MRTVKEVSFLTGVSVRTLHYYDEIGLLKPVYIGDNAYRYYDESSIFRLNEILFFRSLGFPLKQINLLLEMSENDLKDTLEKHIKQLRFDRENLDRLILKTEALLKGGIHNMGLNTIGKEEQALLEDEAKRLYGDTQAFKEYQAKQESDKMKAQEGLMLIFKEFSSLKDLSPNQQQVQEKVKDFTNYITTNFYTCNDKVLTNLLQIYQEDKRFQEVVDNECGIGTLNFVVDAISNYLENRR